MRYVLPGPAVVAAAPELGKLLEAFADVGLAMVREGGTQIFHPHSRIVAGDPEMRRGKRRRRGGSTSRGGRKGRDVDRRRVGEVKKSMDGTSPARSGLAITTSICG